MQENRVVLRIDNSPNIRYSYIVITQITKTRIKKRVTPFCVIGLGAVYSETIYTKDGEKIQAKITEVTENAIWYELTSGDITEYIGVDKSDVQWILNDDGTKFDYSQTTQKEGAKSEQSK